MVALGGVRLGSQAPSSGAAGRDGCEDSQLPMVATPARRSPGPRNPNPSLPGRAVALRSGGAGGAEARHLELPERPPGVSGLTDGTRGPGSQGRWGGRCPPSSSPSRGRRTKPGPAHAWRPRAPLQLAEPLRGSQPPPPRAGTRGVRPAGHLTAPRRGLRERVGRTATAGGGGGGRAGPLPAPGGGLRERVVRPASGGGGGGGHSDTLGPDGEPDLGAFRGTRKTGLGDLQQGCSLTPGASCKPEGQPSPGLHLPLVPAPGPCLTTCRLMASSEVGISFLLSFLPEHLSAS